MLECCEMVTEVQGVALADREVSEESRRMAEAKKDEGNAAFKGAPQLKHTIVAASAFMDA